MILYSKRTYLIAEKLIAHRGASAYAPENTLVAFNKAFEMGARCVEFDVMLSEDNEAFVFHDEKLKRTSNGKGEFGHVKAEYLKSLDAGSWFSKKFKGEKIPTFEEMLTWLIEKQVHANIEIKPFPGCTEQTTIKILSLLNQLWPADRGLPLISSFDWQALALCRQLAPEMPLGLLMHEWQEAGVQKAQDLGCVSIHLNKRITTAKRVDALKKNGFLIYVYTINRARQAKKLFNWGVDAVFTDYPDLL